MRIAYLLLPLSFASAAVAGPSLVVEVTGLGARPAPALASAPSPAHTEARALLEQRCALCHGQSGRADGIMSASLVPRPRDLSDPTWQRSVTDEQIAKVILHGGPAIGQSPIMPANPDLAKKPLVVEELVRLLRSFERRGVVRAVVVDEGGAVRGSTSAPPDSSGKGARLSLPVEGTGPVVVRGFFDLDEDGQQGAREPSFEKQVLLAEEETRISVELKAASRSP